MANGMNQALQETSRPVIVKVKDYSEPLYFAVGPLKRYDAIIRKEWCEAHDAIIDCRKNQVAFKHKGKDYLVSADEPLHSPFVSANTIVSELEIRHA